MLYKMLGITRFKSVQLGISGYNWVLYEAKQLKTEVLMPKP